MIAWWLRWWLLRLLRGLVEAQQRRKQHKTNTSRAILWLLWTKCIYHFGLTGLFCQHIIHQLLYQTWFCRWVDLFHDGNKLFNLPQVVIIIVLMSLFEIVFGDLRVSNNNNMYTGNYMKLFQLPSKLWDKQSLLSVG